MGQQQLLLLVMGVIIVAIAIMAGFYGFEVGFKHQLADNLVERNLEIASEAIAWKVRTDPYRGGNASFSDLADGGMEKLFMGEATLNGCHKFTTADGDDLVIEARSLRFPDVGAKTTLKGEKIVKTETYHDGTITITCDADEE